LANLEMTASEEGGEHVPKAKTTSVIGTLIIPENEAHGVPADVVAVYKTRATVILDFALRVPPTAVPGPETGEQGPVAVLSARVVIPSLIFPSVLKALQRATEQEDSKPRGDTGKQED